MKKKNEEIKVKEYEIKEKKYICGIREKGRGKERKEEGGEVGGGRIWEY